MTPLLHFQISGPNAHKSPWSNSVFSLQSFNQLSAPTMTDAIVLALSGFNRVLMCECWILTGTGG